MERSRYATPRARLEDQVRQWADVLDASEFRALSNGIGIGNVRPVAHPVRGAQRAVKGATKMPIEPARRADSTIAARMRDDAYEMASIAPSELVEGRPMAVPIVSDLVHEARGQSKKSVARTKSAPSVKAPKPRPAKLGFATRLFAWGIDLLFVAASLGAALALAATLAAVRAGETQGTLDWLGLPPVQWLAGFGPYHILGGVYGAFLIYNLIFRLLAGRTVGESLLGATRKAPRKTVKA